MAVRGRVIDGGDGSPLAGAVVALLTGLSDVEVPEKRVKTGADGQFEILGFERTGDEIRLRASHDQYRGPPLVRKLGYEVPSDPSRSSFTPGGNSRQSEERRRRVDGPRSRAHRAAGMRRDYVLANLRRAWGRRAHAKTGLSRSSCCGSFESTARRSSSSRKAIRESRGASCTPRRGREGALAGGGNRPHERDAGDGPRCRRPLAARCPDRAASRRAGASQPAAVVHSGRDGAYEFEGLERARTKSRPRRAVSPPRARRTSKWARSSSRRISCSTSASRSRGVSSTTRDGALRARSSWRSCRATRTAPRANRRMEPAPAPVAAEGAVIARTKVEGRYRVEHFLERIALSLRACGHEPSEWRLSGPVKGRPELVCGASRSSRGRSRTPRLASGPLFRLYLSAIATGATRSSIPRDFDDPQGRFSLDSLPRALHRGRDRARVRDVRAGTCARSGGSFDARVSLERG
jgi:hypothetical protein